jgi:putative sterol carrier protein
MPIFTDAQEVYQHLGGLLEDVVADEELGGRLQQELNTVVQYRLRGPDSMVTLKLVAEEAREVDMGPTPLKPEVVVAMEADLAHRFWLGEVNPTVAMAKGQLLTKGPASKILKLVPALQPVFGRYRERLATAGREDLLHAS